MNDPRLRSVTQINSGDLVAPPALIIRPAAFHSATGAPKRPLVAVTSTANWLGQANYYISPDDARKLAKTLNDVADLAERVASEPTQD